MFSDGKVGIFFSLSAGVFGCPRQPVISSPSISLLILIFFIYFCLGMLGKDNGLSYMAWQMNPSLQDLTLG